VQKETNQSNPTSTLKTKETSSSNIIAKSKTTTKATKATVTCIEKNKAHPTTATAKKKATTTTAMANATTTTKPNIAIVTSKEIEQENITWATTKESGKVKSFNARENTFMAATSVIYCNICQTTICLSGQAATTFLNKIIACCGISSSVHAGCAITFNKCVDSCYEFDAKTYVMNSAIKLSCTQCKQKCFYCGKNHVMNDKDVSIMVCTECKKIWSYHINPSCKNKYDKNISKPPMCVHYNVPNKDRDNVSTQRSPSSLAHSQYLSPISSVISSTDLMEPMINLINTLLINDVTLLDDFQNVEECKEFIHLYLTHLHIQLHNIFSPSFPSGQDKFRMYLSVDAVLRLLNINNKGRFNDEIFTFFCKDSKFTSRILSNNKSSSCSAATSDFL